MAAPKTSLVFLIFALIAISAHLQMASALEFECATGKSLGIKLLDGAQCTLDTDCVELCEEQCDLNFKGISTVSACILGLLEVQVKSCCCCCVTV
ncbi:hypothetical protein MKW92_032438 [Papaver armeniacum]|nr:hypothetical protein MKW92_032438 [Papaver armeniacum]